VLSGPVTLTSKWGHGSPVSWLPSILDLGSGTDKTDRRTDRQQPPMNYALPNIWELGHRNGPTF